MVLHLANFFERRFQLETEEVGAHHQKNGQYADSELRESKESSIQHIGDAIISVRCWCDRRKWHQLRLAITTLERVVTYFFLAIGAGFQ